MKGFFLLIFLAVFIFPCSALAHGMMAYWEVESTIHVEVFFSDGAPAKGVEVTVLGPDGTPISEGMTDEGGRFPFRAEGEGPFTVICQGELGHRTEAEIDLTGRSEQERGRAEKRIPLREVFAGLGYIFGAAGILIWIFSRRKGKR